MNYVRLGNSGLKITELTFGTALTIGTENSSEQYAQELIDTAWDCGIRSFDTSNNYGNGEAERLLGKALTKYPRQDYVLSTKGSWPVGDGVYYSGLSRKHILWAFNKSIERLNTEYIDVYYAHRPDNEVTMEEVARTFNNLIESNKILYWATSEWSIEQLSELYNVCDKLGLEKPITEQFIYSYAITKAESNGVKEKCDSEGVGTLAFSPLAQGLLTGKYSNGIPENSRIAKSKLISYDKTQAIFEQNKARIEFFINTCNEYDIGGNAAALQWCVRKSIFPVIGASKPQQIRDNVESLNVEIPDRFWSKLEANV